MEELRTILKVEVKSSSTYTLKNIFSHLAEEPEIQIFHTDNPEASHYFLRFSSPIFSEYALNHRIALDDVSVFSVNENLTLVKEYHHVRLKCMASTSSWKSLGIREASRDLELLPMVPGSSNLTIGVDTLPREPSHHSDSTFQPPLCVKPQVKRHDYADSSTLGFLSKGAKLIPRNTAPLSNEMKSKVDKAAPPEHRSIQSGILGLACETQVNLNICGETITLDLKKVCSEPKVITELFRVTKSERGNYLAVAAFYRRKKEPESARQVLLSMINEFTSLVVSGEELQPAYLLLSGCELDMARQAKNDKREPAVISSHYSAAQKWLQMVFGKAKSGGTEKKNGPVPFRIVASFKEKERMEQEIETLRDWVGKQESQISELDSSKRKLQDDLLYERDTRRRLELKLEHMERQA